MARSKSDGTPWHTGGEVKGKDVNGVVSQQPCIVRRKMVYPALVPTLKTCHKLASSMGSRELGVKLVNFNITVSIYHLTTVDTEWVQLFPVLWYMIWDICQLQLCWHTVAVVQYTLHAKVWAVPRLCKFYPCICLTTEEKARRNLS